MIELIKQNKDVELKTPNIIGGYYIPNVDEEGNLSWDKTHELMEDVETVCVKGAVNEEEVIDEAVKQATSKSKVTTAEEASNSHRKITVFQNGACKGNYDVMGKQCGGTGQSWYLTDYSLSGVSGDYTASLGYNNQSSGNGNIIGGIKNDFSSRAGLIVGESNNISAINNKGVIVGGYKNESSILQNGTLLMGECNRVNYCATGAIIGGKYASVYNNDVFVIGNGTSTGNRKNLIEYTTDGEIYRSGVFTVTRSANGTLTFDKDGVTKTARDMAQALHEDFNGYVFRVKAESTDEDGNKYTNTTIVSDFVEVVKADGTKEIRLVAHDNIRIFMIYFHFNKSWAYQNVTSTADKIKDLALGSIF